MKIERYDLKLNIAGKGETFHGEETISLKGDSEELVLDAVSMKFKKVLVNGREADYSYEKDQLRIEEEINGPADVFIDFTAEYSTTLNGMYMANVPEGKVVTTQFEATGARHTFPCIDNPAYKAEFLLSLIIDSTDEAISNMPLKGETFYNGTKIVEFEKTPRMSTYLLYIGAGRFEHKKIDYKGKDLILTAPAGLFNSTTEPIEVASKILAYYEDYFDIDFVLPKMHFISVPEFAAGAMENWGAITFREVALNLNENTGTFTRSYVLMVLAHEIAHQWFGNLVTMKWWDDLWLNESFANFMGYNSIDTLFDELDMWAFYFNTELAAGLRGDSLKSTHAIHVEVTDPDSIEQIFDEISYNKGGAILRMIESFMGKSAFRDGIRDYLKANSYSNATSKDLWDALNRHSDYNVNEVMESWINLGGHPVVSVKKDGENLTLNQKTFKLLGSYEGDLWKIPLTVYRNSGTESMLLETREGTIKSDGFIKLNRNTAGFYRTLYDEELFSGIVKHLNELTNYDIWGIVNDNFDFMLSGDIEPDTYLKRLSYFLDNNDPLIIRAITNQFNFLRGIIEHKEKIIGMGRKYLQEKIEFLGDHVKGEDSGISMVRESVSNTLTEFDPEYAKKLAPEAEHLESVHPDLRQSVLMAHALDRNDLEFLMNLLKNSKNDEDREKIIMGLGMLKGTDKLEKADATIDSGLIKAQDSYVLYFSMSSQDSGRAYILENFHNILKKIRKVFAGTMTVSTMVERLLTRISLLDKEKTLKILEEINTPDATTGKTKAREYIEIYTSLRERFT